MSRLTTLRDQESLRSESEQWQFNPLHHRHQVLGVLPKSSLPDMGKRSPSSSDMPTLPHNNLKRKLSYPEDSFPPLRPVRTSVGHKIDQQVVSPVEKEASPPWQAADISKTPVSMPSGNASNSSQPSLSLDHEMLVRITKENSINVIPQNPYQKLV